MTQGAELPSPASPPDQAALTGSQFPYHTDQDDLVSRRGLLQFAVLTSGALFGGTTLLAILNLLNNRKRGTPRSIARVSQVAEGEVFYFNYPEADDQAVLLHLTGGQFVAYSQKCTHLSCSVFYQPDQKRLYCPCHEGVFDLQTGNPVAGPPQRRLPRITIRLEGDTIVAVEEVP